MLGSLKIRNVAIVFMVADLRRTQDFYSRSLGLSFEEVEPSAGYLLALLPGQVELLFFEGEAVRGQTPQVVFGLDEGGIESVTEALASRGVEIVTPVSEAPGGWSVDFRDPDGHLLSLFQDGNLPTKLG